MSSTEQSFSDRDTDLDLRSSLEMSDDNEEQQLSRQYYNDPSSPYPFPSNRIGNHLKWLHDLFVDICGTNFKAPVDRPLRSGTARVLDVGCGAGWWTFDMAREFRSAWFTGIDMAPVFPQTGNPSNVQFVCHNVLQGLPFQDNTFDFVFQRSAVTSYTQAQWAEIVIPELLRVTRPNGWIEFTEAEPHFNNGGDVTRRVTNLVNKFHENNNIDMNIARRLPQLLQSTGQISTTHRHESVFEYGSNAAVRGEQLRRHFRISMLSMKPRLLSATEMMDEHFEALVETASHEMARNNANIKWHHLVFQKRANA